MAKSVLIADDEEDSRVLLAMTLERAVAGVRVDAVSDGKSLVEMARKGGYSLIVTDNTMPPGMPGIDAIKRIREFDHKTPIYVLGSDGVREEALNAGATGFIQKIIDFNAQRAQIKDIAMLYLQ